MGRGEQRIWGHIGGVHDHLFLDIFSDLIIQLKFLLKLLELVLFNVSTCECAWGWRKRRVEEVEEGFRGLGFANETCPVRVW